MTKKITKSKKKTRAPAPLKPLPEEDRYRDDVPFGLDKFFRVFDRIPPGVIAGQGLLVSAVICWFVAKSDMVICVSLAIGSAVIWGAIYFGLKQRE